MFKKIPMGLAALTFISGEAKAMKLSKHKHHRYTDHTLSALSAESVPNCNSYECNNNKAVLGYEGLIQTGDEPQHLSTQGSDPAWNSLGGYSTNTAAYPLAQVSSSSIPACNSYQHANKECEVATAAAPLMQVSSSSIPACNSYQHANKECEVATAAAPLMQVSS